MVRVLLEILIQAMEQIRIIMISTVIRRIVMVQQISMQAVIEI